MRKKQFLAVLSAACIALGLTGCGSTSQEATKPVPAQPTDTQPAEPTNDQSPESTDSPAHAKGPFADTTNGIEAIKAAESQNGGKLIELDREDRDQVWEVEVIEGSEKVTYYVSADGSVTEHKRKAADQDDIAKVADAISATEAIQKAFDELGGGFLDECELDENNGIIVYEMDFDDENGSDFAEIEIDSRTGDITKKELD
ncbi:MAG: PepSY domain-containing protein [Actinomycetaceae bacterium]|nr:PepSY domain-containing protein [Actinomycetaceae bacterium]